MAFLDIDSFKCILPPKNLFKNNFNKNQVGYNKNQVNYSSSFQITNLQNSQLFFAFSFDSNILKVNEFFVIELFIIYHIILIY